MQGSFFAEGDDHDVLVQEGGRFSARHDLAERIASGNGHMRTEHILHGGWQSLDLSDLSVERVVKGQAFREKAVV